MRVRIRKEGFIPHDQEATVELNESHSLLLKFIDPFESNGVVVAYAVAKTRHEGESFDRLDQGKSVLCNLTAQPTDKAISATPLDLSWWRGGNAVITDVVTILKKELD